MTQRRRFFPAKRVQRAPGQVVQLDMQLHPQGTQPVATPPPPPAGGCECDVEGVAWYGDWFSWEGVDSREWMSGAYLYEGTAHDMREMPGSVSGWGGRLVGAYVDIPSGETPSIWRGVVLGRTLCDVQWTWTVDVPPFSLGAGDDDGDSDSGFEPYWQGLTIEAVGGTLLVNVGFGWDYDWNAPPWWAELRATATCAGKPVGTLVLRPGFNFWNSETGLPRIELEETP